MGLQVIVITTFVTWDKILIVKLKQTLFVEILSVKAPTVLGLLRIYVHYVQMYEHEVKVGVSDIYYNYLY